MVSAAFELAKRIGLNTLRTGAFLDCGPAAAQSGPWFQRWDPARGAPIYNDSPDGLERRYPYPRFQRSAHDRVAPLPRNLRATVDLLAGDGGAELLAREPNQFET
jgi:hypothetical protein